MKSRPEQFFIFALFFIYCFTAQALFARGKAEVPDETMHNTEWVLTVTAFDTTALPASQRILGGLVIRNIINAIKDVDYRLRDTDEYEFYKNNAWSKKRLEAAQALARKRNDRDALLFKGDTDWKYRRDLKAMDEQIVKLEEALREALDASPLVEGKPLFKLADSAITESYPPPPKEGTEYTFLQRTRADAFLAGSIGEYHGRIYLELKLYALYSQSYVYEDYAVFSHNDHEGPVGEIAARLNAYIARTDPVQVMVMTDPPDAVVIVNDAYIGRTNEKPVSAFPGEMRVRTYAENYASAEKAFEIKEGEIARLHFKLAPLPLYDIEIQTPEEGASVYHGVLYVGKTPITLGIPQRRYSYVMVEAPSGDTARTVFQGQDGSINMVPMDPVISGSKSVEAMRRRFYGAYGRFWLTLPLAIIFSSVSSSEVYRFNQIEEQTVKAYSTARDWYYYSMAATILAGSFFVETLVRYIFYLRASSRGLYGVIR